MSGEAVGGGEEEGDLQIADARTDGGLESASPLQGAGHGEGDSPLQGASQGGGDSPLQGAGRGEAGGNQGEEGASSTVTRKKRAGEVPSKGNKAGAPSPETTARGSSSQSSESEAFA